MKSERVVRTGIERRKRWLERAVDWWRMSRGQADTRESVAILRIHSKGVGPLEKEHGEVLQEWIAEKWADALFNEREATPEEVFRGSGGEIMRSLAAAISEILGEER